MGGCCSNRKRACLIIELFVSKLVQGFWLNLIVGILYLIVGIYILMNLGVALLGLTLPFGILFIIEKVMPPLWPRSTGLDIRCPSPPYFRESEIP